jgi:predicted RNase H-like HicB family nuclease
MNSEIAGRDINYPVKIEFDEQDGLYIAEFMDLPGCSASGATVQEAYQHAEIAKEEWMRLAEEQGLRIPKPSRAEEYSGRILLRLPPSLHGMLAEHAKLQATSLNQYAVHLLSGAIVGDGVRTQIDQLRGTVTQLEQQLGQLTRKVELSFSQLARQIAGQTATAQGSIFGSSSQKTGGSAYEASGGHPC